MGLFFLSKVTFSYPNTRILLYSDPYSTHFVKTTVFYRIHQECTRTHKNTSKFVARALNSAKVRKCHRIPSEYRVALVFSEHSHRIRSPSEYQSRIPRGTEQNTQKNTVFFIVFRIRQRIRYFTCRIPTSIALAAFARPCGRLLDEGDRARLCVDWFAIPIQGGGHMVSSPFHQKLKISAMHSLGKLKY